MEAEVITPDTTVSGQIKREIAVTQESLTEKIAALETQVFGSVRTAADTLADTVGAVKSIVTEAPSVVTNSVRQAAAIFGETVQDTLDLAGHVQRKPWVALSGSICLGCLIGRLTSRKSQQASSSRPTMPGEALTPVPASDAQPGVVDEFLNLIGNKARDLARTALDSTFTAVSEIVKAEAPRLLAKALPESVLSMNLNSDCINNCNYN